MSNVSNSAKSLARTKMREAKERGEDLKYTAALSEVADTSHILSNSTPLTDILPRIRAAMRVIEEGMCDNPCYTDDTRKQVRVAVANIINSSGDKPKTYTMGICGFRGTGKHHIAEVINKALIASGTVSDRGVKEYSPKTPPKDFSCLTWDVASDFSLGDMRLSALNDIREKAYKNGSSMTGVIIIVLSEHSKDSAHYRRIPSRVSTWIPPTNTLVEVIERHAQEKGFTLTDNAISEFEYALGRFMDNRDFYYRRSWNVVLNNIVNRAIALRIENLVDAGDTDFDTKICAEDINEAVHFLYLLKNYSPIPDRKPVPSQLEAHRLESVDAWDVDYWDDTPGCIDDPVLGAYRDRSFTTSYSARFRINESGTVFGDLDVARQLIDDMVVSRCVRNTPYNFTLAAFVPEGDVPVWSELPHVELVTDNTAQMFEFLRKESLSREGGAEHAPLHVLFLREDIESFPTYIRDGLNIHGVYMRKTLHDEWTGTPWSIAVEGSRKEDIRYMLGSTVEASLLCYDIFRRGKRDAVFIRGGSRTDFTMFQPEDNFNQQFVNRIIECWNKRTE